MYLRACVRLTFSLVSGVSFISSRFSMLCLLPVRDRAPAHTQPTHNKLCEPLFQSPHCSTLKPAPAVWGYRSEGGPSPWRPTAWSCWCCSSDPAPSAGQTRSYGQSALHSCLQSGRGGSKINSMKYSYIHWYVIRCFLIMKMNDIKDDMILNIMTIQDIFCNNTSNAGLHTHTTKYVYNENYIILIRIKKIL